MHKKRSNKHSKSKSNTLNFRIGYKKNNKNTTNPNTHYTPNHDATHAMNTANKPMKPFVLPPLTQVAHITTNGNHTSPSTSASTFYPKLRTDTNISISSELHPPHSPSASYSFSENNSLTNPDFIVIEPQQYHSHFIQSQHQKHFHPHLTHYNEKNRPQSTPQLKTFKFDENAVVINTQSNSTTITPTQTDNVQLPSNPNNAPSPSQQSHSQSQLSQNERFQQLMPDSSTTAMTPTPSPSAPNQPWTNITSSSSPLHPATNIVVPLDHLDLNNCNASSSSLPPLHPGNKFRRYKHKTHVQMNPGEAEMDAMHRMSPPKTKNVKIGQTTMHPYRLYNEPGAINIHNVHTDAMHLLDRPLHSQHSAYSIETEASISRSLDVDEEKGHNPRLHNHPGRYNPVPMMTANTNYTTKQKIKSLKVTLTPTTSTPIRSPERNNAHHNHPNVTWQTYIGHFVFHEHDRGHSLYHSFKKIGEGVFARVYKTVRKDPQRMVALKVFPKKNQHAEGSFANELMLMHNVSHPNIVKLYDAHVDPKYFYLEMEVCRGGDIFKWLSHHGRIEERFTRQIIYKLVDAIRCFHERDFVHRDLKPENIVFVHKNDITDIRLIDFGESIHIDPQQYYNEFVGTPCYFAPERFRQQTGAELKKSDVWAIGVIMFEMLTGCRCFNGGDNQYEVRSNVLARKTEQWPLDLVVSNHAMDFWKKLLEIEPVKRYSCQEALRHPWLIDIFQHKQQLDSFVSPRLTPLQTAVQNNVSPPQQPVENIESMQAIVIRTSQSMTNLKSIFAQQLDARNLRKKAQQRKYKDLLDDDNNHEDRGAHNGDHVPWQVRITRKKSRSLEHNEFQASLREDGGAYQKLSIPKHVQNQYKYRAKHRSATFGAHSNVRMYSSATLSNHSPVANIEINISRANQCNGNDHDVVQDVITPAAEDHDNDDELPSTVIKLKHQKSLSSPAMNISIEEYSNAKASNKAYHPPPPVDEDHEQTSCFDMDHNQWRTNSKSSYFGGPSMSYSSGNDKHEKKHSATSSFSIYEHSSCSFTEEVDDNIDTVIEDKTMD